MKAVYFFSPRCPHCEEVMREDLTTVLQDYDGRLEILCVNTDGVLGARLLQDAAEAYRVPPSRRGVPALIIGDTYLRGETEIRSLMRPTVRRYAETGGVAWPNVPGLESAFSEERSSVVQKPSALGAVADSRRGVWERVSGDPLGNALALVVLVVMLVIASTVAWRLARTAPRLPRRLRSIGIPVLIVFGLSVAGYMAYVESTGMSAMCGVGDCNAVQQSQWARLFGVVPVAYIGLIGYLMIGITYGVSCLASGKVAQVASGTMFGATLVAVLFSIYLTVLEPFVIGASCVWCLSSSLVATFLLVLSADLVRPGRRRAQGASAEEVVLGCSGAVRSGLDGATNTG